MLLDEFNLGSWRGIIVEKSPHRPAQLDKTKERYFPRKYQKKTGIDMFPDKRCLSKRLIVFKIKDPKAFLEGLSPGPV